VRYIPKNFHDGKEYPFIMNFSSYLQSAAQLKDEVWKLINRPLKNGEVFLIRHDLIMLLREVVRKKTLPNVHDLDQDLKKDLESIPDIDEIIRKVAEMIQVNTSRFHHDLLFEGETIGSDLFPPCIRFLLYRLAHGENLTHYERLSLAFFFLNTNHSIEETVDLFRTSPDFDEKIARYQVEYAAGSAGKGKKYSMYSCAKLKTFQICRATDNQFGELLCANGFTKKDGTNFPVKNPARDYIFWKQVQLNRIHSSQIKILESTMKQGENEK
jgi:DNA primase large subunit